MTRPVEPIPHRYWLHISGREASLYGAAPWTSAADKPNWQLVESGWTWRDNRSGTVGLCRAPVATLAEAEDIATRFSAAAYPNA